MNRYMIVAIAICLVSNAYAGSLQIVPCSPCQRSMATMIMDTYNQRVIMFGGQDYGFSGRYFNDIWTLDINSETWQLLTLSQPTPSPRRNAALAYDTVNNRIFLFGGRTGSTLYNDLWVLDLTMGAEYWVELTPSGTPPSPRTEVTGIIDPINNRLMVFGGDTYSGRVNDTWELDLNTTTWFMLNPSGSLPLVRSAYSAVYDPTGHRMIVFSGASSPILNDLWALDLTYGSESWQELNPGGNIPQGRAQPFCAYDSQNNRMITGFGFAAGLHSDAWALDLDSLYWRRILTPNLVHPRRGSCAAFNILNGEVVIFGGDNGGSAAELYSLTTDTLAILEHFGSNVVISPYLQIVTNPSRLPCKMNVFVPQPGNVSLKILDVSGRVIRHLIENTHSSGNYIVSWNGDDSKGRKVASGTYFIKLEIDGESVVQKAVVIE